MSDQLERKFLLFVTLVSAFGCLVDLSESRIAEIFFDDEVDTPEVETLSHIGEQSPQHVVFSETANTCHMEFQVMKRVTGHCVKIGKTTRGCVSGTYIHPFHHDCL